MKTVGLGIMASGRGSNAKTILQHCADGHIPAEGKLVISNNANAGVHQIAKSFGVESRHIARNQFEDGKRFADTLIEAFRSKDVELVLLAGYMKKVPPALLRAFPNAVLNIHPALLPRHGGKGMYGMLVHEAVIRDGDDETGVTIHYVDEEYDRGPILHQVGGVMVQKGETAESLAHRVLKIEHEAYPEAVNLWIKKHR